MRYNTSMHLTAPSMDYAPSYEEALAERKEHDSNPAHERSWYDEIGSPQSTEEYITLMHDHSEGRNLPPGWIPATMFWLADEQHFYGEVNIRHELNEHLRTIGGHIGYWIRPSERGKGYGSLILELGLQKAEELGLTEVVVTCDEDNERSRNVIESNGGVFEKATPMPKGVPAKLVYWIYPKEEH